MTHFSLDEVILQNNYSGLTLKILTALKLRLDFNNRIRGFRQAELAEQLNTTQANVSRNLKLLENDKIILRDGVDYYFNTKYLKGAGGEKKEKNNSK